MIIGVLTGYYIYGSTLIDITSEASISKHLSVDPEQPITIFETAKNGDYFAVLYSDPTDTDKSFYHFRYITKARLYKNKYYNIGGDGSPGFGTLQLNEANSSDADRTTAETFIYRAGEPAANENTCSIFKYNLDESYINFDEITDEQQIADRIKKQAASFEKLDEIELADQGTFIIEKTYQIDKPTDILTIEPGSVSEAEIRQRVLDTIDNAIEEYNAYKEAQSNENK